MLCCGSVARPVLAIQEQAGDVQIGELERRLEGIRAEREQVVALLEAARREGAERRVAELEQQFERLREKLHYGEQMLSEARRRHGERKELRQPDLAERDHEQRAWQTRLEHAQQAVRHLREAELPDLAEMAARRTEELHREWRQRQAARQQETEARAQHQRAESQARADLVEREGPREAQGGDGTGRADRERQWEVLRELGEQIQGLRREVNELKNRIDR